MRIKNSYKGFTLIELLIVVIIIGALGAIFVSNYLGVRERGRDSQRKSNLRQIHAALELYRYDQGSYPATLLNCPVVTPTYLGNSTCTAGTVYMQKIPTDPQGSLYYNSGNYYYSVSGGSSYTLCACLENKNDNQGEANSICSSITPACPGGANAKFFVVQNQ